MGSGAPARLAVQARDIGKVRHALFTRQMPSATAAAVVSPDRLRTADVPISALNA